MCSYYRCITLAVALGLSMSASHAQPHSLPPLDRYLITFESIPSPNFSRVNTIIRDDRGFLWFGTTKGLCKYDGYQMQVFPGQSPLDGIITAMAKLDHESLLLGTGRGPWIFNLRTEQLTRFSTGSESSETRINDIAVDSSGTIWIGTSSQGLIVCTPATRAARRFTASKGLSDNRITALLIDGPNRVWIGTVGGGLDALDPTTGHIRPYLTTGPSGPRHVTALCKDADGNLWVGTNDGLSVLDPGTGHVHQMDLHSYTKHTIMSIARDGTGRMWIGASDLGLLSSFHGTLTQLTPSGDAERSLNTIMAVYPDPVASTPSNLLLWVGTHTGVDKILMSTNPFTNSIRNQEGLRLDRGAVLSLCEDRHDVLWVGLWGGGLDVFRRIAGTYQRIASYQHGSSTFPPLPDNDVEGILEDHQGNLWIATHNGLVMLDAQRRHAVVDRHVDSDTSSLVGNAVARILEDRSGRIWISTTSGLSEFVGGRPHRFKNYLHDPADAHPLGGNEVGDLWEDGSGNLWIPTSGRGLIKRDRQGNFSRFVFPGDSSGIHENWIFSVVDDREGVLWLGTNVGLVSFDPRSNAFRRHTISQLSESHIFGIVIDHQNALWMSTSIGLGRYDPQARTFVRYDRDDGIPFAELRSSFVPSRGGTVFVGGLDGFTEFNPDSIRAEGTVPAVMMTGFSIFDQAMPATLFAAPEIVLDYNQNFFSFSFAALDYTDPKRNSYSYRMVGLDPDWQVAGHRNYARYTNIEPGEYLFEVKGAGSNEVWNEKAASLRIIITPPYWRSWWFRLTVLISLVAAAYAAYRYRLRHLLHVERLRLRIAHDLHDDVGSNLSAIAIASKSAQLLPELPARARRKLSEIYDTARATSEGMRDLVWFIKPETDELDDLFLHMRESAPLLLGEVDVECHFPPSSNSTTISVDFKRAAFLAFKEIVTNIAKHAHASKVAVRVTAKNGVMEMLVHDDGKGFDTKAQHSGTGLVSLRKRAETLDGSCDISSQPGQGTTVRFTGRLR